MRKRSRKIIKHIFNRVKSLFCGFCKSIVSVLLFVEKVLINTLNLLQLIPILMLLFPKYYEVILKYRFHIFIVFLCFGLLKAIKPIKRENL